MMCTLPILSLRMHCLIRNIKIIIIIFGNRHIHHTIPLPIAIGKFSSQHHHQGLVESTGRLQDDTIKQQFVILHVESWGVD